MFVYVRINNCFYCFRACDETRPTVARDRARNSWSDSPRAGAGVARASDRDRKRFLGARVRREKFPPKSKKIKKPSFRNACSKKKNRRALDARNGRRRIRARRFNETEINTPRRVRLLIIVFRRQWRMCRQNLSTWFMWMRRACTIYHFRTAFGLVYGLESPPERHRRKLTLFPVAIYYSDVVIAGGVGFYAFVDVKPFDGPRV